MQEARSRHKWCVQVIFKLREAAVKLSSMLGCHKNAVRMALQNNMLKEAQSLASKSADFGERRDMWLSIARELLEV